MTPSRTTAGTQPELYVQMPAYRDNELAATLRDLYTCAVRPERLRVRVMWQRAEDESLPDDVRALPGLEIDEVPATTSEAAIGRAAGCKRRGRASGTPFFSTPTTGSSRRGTTWR